VAYAVTQTPLCCVFLEFCAWGGCSAGRLTAFACRPYAAGMSLVDTTVGVLMLGAYNWAPPAGGLWRRPGRLPAAGALSPCPARRLWRCSSENRRLRPFSSLLNPGTKLAFGPGVHSNRVNPWSVVERAGLLIVANLLHRLLLPLLSAFKIIHAWRYIRLASSEENYAPQRQLNQPHVLVLLTLRWLRRANRSLASSPPRLRARNVSRPSGAELHD
jgi:hypothetical protein